MKLIDRIDAIAIKSCRHGFNRLNVTLRLPYAGDQGQLQALATQTRRRIEERHRPVLGRRLELFV